MYLTKYKIGPLAVVAGEESGGRGLQGRGLVLHVGPRVLHCRILRKWGHVCALLSPYKHSDVLLIVVQGQSHVILKV